MLDDCWLAEEDLMILHLPLLTRVLSVLVRVLACIFSLSNLLDIKVPDTDDEVSELCVSLELLVEVLMVLQKLLHANGSFSSEAGARVVELSEHLEEAETDLLDSLEASLHIWMASWIKFLFDFTHFKSTTLVFIKLLESFLNETATVGWELTAKSR